MAKEPDEEQAQGAENIRRVYALPAEMVERITRFQRDKGLPSEVEAVRRLLDEALKSRDDLDTIINRLLARLGQTRIAAEAAKEVLAGHPLVKSISFEGDKITFVLKNEDGATVSETGFVYLRNQSDKWEYDDKSNRYAGGSSGYPF
jgi:hypothetical protein